MSFNLRVRFTGICTFVPNQDKSKYYVVLSNGEAPDDGDTFGADNVKLRRHRAFVRFKVRNLKGVQSTTVADSTVGIWYFRKRIEEGASPDEKGHDLIFRCTSAESSLKVVDLSNLADLEDFAPKFCTVDPYIITGPVPDGVAGRVLIDKGILRSNGDPRDWVVLNTLNPIPLDEPALNPTLTNEVVWELTGLNSLQLIMAPFETGTAEALSFQEEDDETLEITVANLCDDNPLQWGPPQQQIRDLDFAWHYQLLDEGTYEILAELLNGRELPVPIPPHANGLGMDCLPASAKTSERF